MFSDRVHGLLDEGKLLVAELPCSCASRRKWLAVYPFRINPETGMSTLRFGEGPWQFNIRVFEIEKCRPEGIDIEEEDLHDGVDREVSGFDDLESALKQWIEDDACLELPGRTDYPL